MTSTVTNISLLISRVRGVCGNQPCITGTRVTIGRIAILWKSGLTAEEIADRIEHLSLGQVYAALAYYHANRQEIEQILEDERREYDRLLALSEGTVQPL